MEGEISVSVHLRHHALCLMSFSPAERRLKSRDSNCFSFASLCAYTPGNIHGPTRARVSFEPHATHVINQCSVIACTSERLPGGVYMHCAQR